MSLTVSDFEAISTPMVEALNRLPNGGSKNDWGDGHVPSPLPAGPTHAIKIATPGAVTPDALMTCGD